MNEEQKWKTLVKVTHARYDLTKNMLKCDRDKQDAIIWADAELTRLRAELSEATDACNGLHEMVKDLQKDNARLRSIVSRVEDVEGMAKRLFEIFNAGNLNIKWLTDNKIDWQKDIARAVRDYAMGEG